MLYLGIDGGGSKTAVSVINEEGRELFTFESGSVNYLFEGIEKARESLIDIAAEVNERAGGDTLGGVFIGCSALSKRATDEEIKSLCGGIFECKTGMDSDIYITLRAAGVKNAIAVIAGTGSMVAGYSGEEIITKGGFGAILGDEGSGYRIAEDALRRAVLSSQDVLPLTALEDEMYSFFDVCTGEELIEKVYGGMSRREIAAFAEKVCECAEKGDEAANEIIDRQTKMLALTVNALKSELPGNPNIFVYGGMFGSEIYRFMFKKHMGVNKLYTPVHTPEYTAALLAGEL